MVCEVFSRAQRPRASSRQGARLPRVSRLQLLDRSGCLRRSKILQLSLREQKRVALAATLDWAPRESQLTCAHVTYVAHWPLQCTMKMPYVQCCVAAKYSAAPGAHVHVSPNLGGQQGQQPATLMRTSRSALFLLLAFLDEKSQCAAQNNARALQLLCGMTFCRVHVSFCCTPCTCFSSAA
jgi:hypothetical protein